jgi:N-acetylglucosamine kinase-like BadF-type ATPase
MHVLGIDAGGTKTVGLLADEKGTVLAEGRGLGANLRTVGELGVEKVLHHVLETVLKGRDVQPAVICIGIAGVDREEDVLTVKAIFSRIARGTKVLVVNDALIALCAGLAQGGDKAQDAPGIVLISGTGAIAYGRNTRGVAARASGWGYLIGDEGSGYWIGRRTLAAVTRDIDGRGPKTALTAAVLEQYEIAHPALLIRAIYDQDVPRARVATLGPLVGRARDAGDQVAARILDEAANELWLAADAVAERLKMRATAFPLVVSGGVFRGIPWLADELERRLKTASPGARVTRLSTEPALGAVSLALQEAHGGVRIPAYE